MRSKHSATPWRIGLCLAGLALGAAGCLAQELRGRVQGTVTDPSEAVVAGAKITLLNVNTGVATVRPSNPAGQYLFDYVSPGTYTLTVEMEGFGRFVQENILVQTRADVTVDAVLRLGGVAESVTVREAPVSLQFNTSTMELTVDTKMANDLPIIHRNVFLLASLDPAVVVRSSSEQAAYHLWAPNELDVGGNTNRKNDLLVDGVPQLLANKSSYVPPMDAVSELNVQQNSVDAEFGHSAGGIVSLQMKSGTNERHGSVYYLGRHPKLNAVANSTTHIPNLVRSHVGGVSSGAPLKKNRIFNFSAFELWRTAEPTTSFYTLPTGPEREGDFSRSLNARGGLRQIFDPWSTRFDAARNTATRTPFADNRVPRSRMDATALRALQDIWAPNHPGDDITGVNNYKYTKPLRIKYWNATSRTDFNLNERWRTFFRYSQFRTRLAEQSVTGKPAERVYGFVSHSMHLSGDAVWTINPSTVFNLRGAYISIMDSFDSLARIQEGLLAGYWPNKWYTSYLTELPALYYPGLNVKGAGGTTGFGRANYWFQEPNTWNLQSKIAHQQGRHYLKAGGEYRNQRILAVRPKTMNFFFGPELTADTFINPDVKLRGDGWACFLLGALDDQSLIYTIPMQRPRVAIFGAYLQDDFRLHRNLTVNLGLRYEFESPMRDPQDRLSRFLDLSSPIPEFQSSPPRLPAEAAALRKSAPVYHGAWVFTDPAHRSSWNPQKRIFLPRLGLAWRVNDRTSLRVGYARYVVPPIMTDGFGILGSTPYPGFDAMTKALPALEGVPQSVLSDPYPAGTNPLIPPVGKSLGRYTNLGGEATWFHQDFRSGVNERLNVSAQRQLPGRLMFDLTYFISLGRDHAFESVGNPKDRNQLDPDYVYGYKAQIDRKVANPFFNYLTREKFPGQLRNQQTVAIRDLLKPYPQYGKLVEMLMPGVSNRYQAWQVKAQRPFANGFNVLLGYNYSRERRQEFFSEDDMFTDRLTWQDSPNPRHRLTLAGICEVPVGRNRALLAHAPSLADAVVGGWSLSGIYTYNSGPFLRFGPALVSGNPRIDNPTRERMFDTSKFTRQPAYTPRTNPWQYPGVSGPRYSNLDLTLAKIQPLTEGLKLEIRMEAYNATNSFMGANPVLNVDSSLFGRVVAQRGGFFGRQFQYSGRFLW